MKKSSRTYKAVKNALNRVRRNMRVRKERKEKLEKVIFYCIFTAILFVITLVFLKLEYWIKIILH